MEEQTRLEKMVRLAKVYKMSARQLAELAGISVELAEHLLNDKEKDVSK